MRTPFKFFVLFTLLLTGCGFAQSPVEYNDKIVAEIQESSQTLQSSVESYLASIPEKITEETTVETDSMEDSFKAAQKTLKSNQKLLTLASKNLEQETEVKKAVATYLSTAQSYLDSYQEMLTYYEGAYQEDPNQVPKLNAKLHANYSTFIEANNDLAGLLQVYVKTSSL